MRVLHRLAALIPVPRRVTLIDATAMRQHVQAAPPFTPLPARGGACDNRYSASSPSMIAISSAPEGERLTAASHRPPRSVYSPPRHGKGRCAANSARISARTADNSFRTCSCDTPDTAISHFPGCSSRHR